jgi:hypothetical protein
MRKHRIGSVGVQHGVNRFDDSAVYVLFAGAPGPEEAPLFAMKGLSSPDALKRRQLYHRGKCSSGPEPPASEMDYIRR